MMREGETTVAENMAVIFDLGRVLINLDVRGSKFSSLMEAMNVPPNQAFSVYWREPEVEWHMTGQISSRQFHQAAIDRFNLDISYEDFVDAWCDLFSPSLGMKEIFERVAKKHTIGLLSDTDPLHWAKAKELLPWLRQVEKPTLSFEIGYMKPHPAAYLKAAENCGRQAEDCLFIDDSQVNVDGAREVGMAAVLFQGPERLARDLTKIGVL